MLLTLLGLAGVSASGPLMAATAAPAFAIALLRNLFATIVIAPATFFGPQRRELTRLAPTTVLLTVGAGVALAGHFAFWITALTLTSVAAAVALVAMQVLWVIVINAVFKERSGGAVVMGALVAVAGVFVITGVDLQFSRDALLGDVYALLGGFFAAVYVVIGARARVAMSTTNYTFVCYGTCSVVLAGLCIVTQTPFTGWSAKAWTLIVVVTLTAQLLGHSVFNHLLAVMSPVVISLVLLLEVPAAALIAAIALGERLPAATWGGLLLILTGLAVVTLLGPRAAASAPAAT